MLAPLGGVSMRKFLKDQSASVTVAIAVGLPVLAGAAAIGMEYARLSTRHSGLQQAADSAALAAAQQMKLANTSDSVVVSVAQSASLADISPTQDEISVDTTIAPK